jgi:hypothetical protein
VLITRERRGEFDCPRLKPTHQRRHSLCVAGLNPRQKLAQQLGHFIL